MSYPVHLFFLREIWHCCPVDLGVNGVMHVGGEVAGFTKREDLSSPWFQLQRRMASHLPYLRIIPVL